MAIKSDKQIEREAREEGLKRNKEFFNPDADYSRGHWSGTPDSPGFDRKHSVAPETIASHERNQEARDRRDEKQRDRNAARFEKYNERIAKKEGGKDVPPAQSGPTLKPSAPTIQPSQNVPHSPPKVDDVQGQIFELQNRLKALEDYQDGGYRLSYGASLGGGGGGLTLDYCIIGRRQVIIPAQTTDFLQILFGESPSVSWVSAMPTTQPSNGVVIDVTKNRLYFTGEFGDG